MKIGGFEPVSLCDFPGTPAAVIFTQGCNWRCPYCHNSSLLSMQSPKIHEQDGILNCLWERRLRLEGVVITGGEPTLQCDLAGFINELKGMGYKVKLDTNGSRPSVIEKLISLGCIDYIAMDIKAPWSKYGALTGVEEPDIESVKRSMNMIGNGPISHHFRTTCPDKIVNTSDIEIIRKTLPASSNYVVQACRDLH